MAIFLDDGGAGLDPAPVGRPIQIGPWTGYLLAVVAAAASEVTIKIKYNNFNDLSSYSNAPSCDILYFTIFRSHDIVKLVVEL